MFSFENEIVTWTTCALRSAKCKIEPFHEFLLWRESDKKG